MPTLFPMSAVRALAVLATLGGLALSASFTLAGQPRKVPPGGMGLTPPKGSAPIVTPDASSLVKAGTPGGLAGLPPVIPGTQMPPKAGAAPADAGAELAKTLPGPALTIGDVAAPRVGSKAFQEGLKAAAEDAGHIWQSASRYEGPQAAVESEFRLRKRMDGAAEFPGDLAVDAAEPSPDPVSQKLSKLRAQGYALVPLEAFITRESRDRIVAQIRERENPNKLPFRLPIAFGISPDSPGYFETPEAMELLRAVTERLERALPKEEFEADSAQFLHVLDASPHNSGPHVDGFYLTVTVSLIGPGTVLYLIDQAGNVTEIKVPEGTVLVITNSEREEVLGIPSIVHSTPDGKMRERVLFRLLYGSRQRVHDDTPEMDQLIAERVERVKAYRSARSSPPESP